MLHTEAKHHLVEDLTTAHTDHPDVSVSAESFLNCPCKQNLRVIELGGLAVLERRNLIAMRFLVECWAGHGSGVAGGMELEQGRTLQLGCTHDAAVAVL